MESIAFGELNMSLEQFYDMCPRNFKNAQDGRKKLYEQDDQAEWERARWMASVIISPLCKKSIDPKKITIFPWEKKGKTARSRKIDIEKLRMESLFDDKIKEMNKLEKNA